MTLYQYLPQSEEQWKLKQKFIEFIEDNPDAYLRSNLQGHLTASVFAVDEDKILLIHHKKLDKWLQPGGHCDGNPDTLEVALKELWEETGILVEAEQQEVIDLDIHLIPERKDVPAHYHYDVRYLVKADSKAPIIQNHETNEILWIPFSEIENYTSEDSILRVIERISSEN